MGPAVRHSSGAMGQRVRAAMSCSAENHDALALCPRQLIVY